MDSMKSSNKITEIVRLQQMLKKWKKLAVAPQNSSKKNIKFLKKTLSFSETSDHCNDVPKGFFAVSVGEEMARYVIPTDYLHLRAFQLLLKEAEEEYGFQHEGVLRIPCEVTLFEKILKMVEKEGSITALQRPTRGRFIIHKGQCADDHGINLLLFIKKKSFAGLFFSSLLSCNFYFLKINK